MSERIDFDIQFLVLIILRGLFPLLGVTKLVHRPEATKVFRATRRVQFSCECGHILIVPPQPVIFIAQGAVVEGVHYLKIIQTQHYLTRDVLSNVKYHDQAAPLSATRRQSPVRRS